MRKEEFKQELEMELSGTGNRTLGSRLFQAIQEPAAGGRAGDRDCRLDAGDGQFPWLLFGDEQSDSADDRNWILDLESFAETKGKLLAARAEAYQMRASSKSAKAAVIGLGVLALVVAWIGFRLGTHRQTGILRTLTQAKHLLIEGAASSNVQPPGASAPAGLQHHVNLSWKASTSVVAGYNVYRRGASAVVKLNSEPVTGTSYVDRTVQPGQTYFYVIKAVNANGGESTASNEIRADIPSP
jgi:hypothetical protein